VRHIEKGSDKPPSTADSSDCERRAGCLGADGYRMYRLISITAASTVNVTPATRAKRRS